MRWTRVAEHLVLALGGLGLGAAGCAGLAGPAVGLSAGQDDRGPWWMRQTAMSRDGSLDLRSKPWWPRAMRLGVGERFMIEENGPAGGNMLVRRERIKNRSKEVEALVWILDDDTDGSLRTGGDEDSDCYVADYGCDGVPDRMVDYMDDDGDGAADEMDIRYYVGGRLNYCWFGRDFDGDGRMWSVRGYEYGGPSFFEADPYGDNMIYMNKFNPVKGTWSPISECPFAFYDTDGDGYSEVVIRFSAVPLGYDPGVHPDYANNQFSGSWDPGMDRMGVVNIRYSFDIDNLSGKETPLHYDCGFNLVGAAPYAFAGMRHVNPRRRPPQVTCVVPYDRVRSVSDHYAARETGFSWHEQHDDTIAIGYGEQQKDDWRWEGVFWIWERRFMENTGGPCQRWNVRREWSSRPSNRRALYYSAVDGRVHLFGAEEGWIQRGHFAGLGSLGEIRMYDTDGNGYFDRWEVYDGRDPLPVRVSTVGDEKVRRLPFDERWLRRFYLEEVVPQATASSVMLLEAMGEVHPWVMPAGLAGATRAGPPGYRRYALDVACELHYQSLRRSLSGVAGQVLAGARMDDLRPLKPDQRAATANSQTAWQLVRSLERLDAAWGQGDLTSVKAAIAELKRSPLLDRTEGGGKAER
ncbi:MAG: hypothetical protein KA354_00890 [Phycisphaerae bacterium]|nr:hypothetical protein [Phycisphaerae bacterium]